MYKIDEKKLYELSILDLRNVARDVGVVACTTYKKQELIDKILKILSGQIKPEIAKSKQGRPPKKTDKASINFEDNDLLREFSNNFFNTNGEYLDEDIVFEKVRWNLLNSTKNGDVIDIFDYKRASGYVKIINNKVYIFINGNLEPQYAISLSKEIIEKVNLRSADYVDFEYKDSEKFNLKVVTKIINLQDFPDNRLNFTKIGRIDITTNSYLPLKFKTFPIKLGGKIIFRTDNLSKCNDIFLSLCALKDFTIVDLHLEASPEFNLKANENFVTYIGDSIKKNALTVELCYSRIKRLIEKGKNVVVCINELMKIVKYQNFSLGYDIRDIKANSFNYVTKLFSLAGCYKNGASVTLMSLYKTDNLTNCGELLLNELKNYDAQIIDLK